MMRASHGVLLVALLIAPTAFASTSAADSLLAKSRAAEQAGKRDAALRFAQAAIVADPARAASYTALGDLYLHASQSDFASFYYSEALAIDPQDPAAQRGLALADKVSQTATAAAASSLDKNQPQH
jgi:tetratricopeptide (TPR) repeat protein